MKARINKPGLIKAVEDLILDMDRTSVRMSHFISDALELGNLVDTGELIIMAKEIRFLADDCVTRLARCRQCLYENEFPAAEGFFLTAKGQANVITEKSHLLEVMAQEICERV